ncbi:MAG: sensor histidine kinase [Magnetococcales bacterium]|nr:sensor histidine kinase [Magnetococcales bacterium]
MKSVSGRLKTGLSALLFMLCLTLFAGSDHLARRFADDTTWNHLSERTRWIGTLLIRSDPSLLNQDHACPEPKGASRFCQWEWQEGKHRQRHLSPSLDGHPLELPILSPGEQMALKTMSASGEEWMMVVHAFSRPEGELVVATAQSRGSQHDLSRSWRLINLAMTLGLFMLAAILFMWFISLAFAPFGQLQAALAQLQSGERRRLDQAGPEETLPLTRLIDRLLSAEERHQNRVRRTLSHLGHSLRIPVTSLAHLAEAPELRHQAPIRSMLTEQTQLLERLIERQLRRASLSGKGADQDRFNLARELSSLIRALHSLHYDKELDIETRIPETLTGPGNRDDLLELIGNLADNACKWARTRVLITAGEENGFWLTIEDDGPGVADATLERLRHTIRLTGDEQPSGPNGLGLLIARDIVELYDGEMLLGRSPELHGFLVRIRLPR